MNTDTPQQLLDAYTERRGIGRTAAMDEVAALLQVNRSLVYHWRTGKRTPPPFALAVLQELASPASPAVPLTAEEIARRRHNAAAAMADVPH